MPEPGTRGPRGDAALLVAARSGLVATERQPSRIVIPGAADRHPGSHQRLEQTSHHPTTRRYIPQVRTVTPQGAVKAPQGEGQEPVVESNGATEVVAQREGRRGFRRREPRDHRQQPEGDRGPEAEAGAGGRGDRGGPGETAQGNDDEGDRLPDHYRALGINDPKADLTPEDLERRLVALTQHYMQPEERAKDPEGRALRRTVTAYRVLSDPDARKTYDTERRLRELEQEIEATGPLRIIPKEGTFDDVQPHELERIRRRRSLAERSFAQDLATHRRNHGRPDVALEQALDILRMLDSDE